MEKEKRVIVFIDNMFGYQNGGCSTINYELCIALRQITTECNDIISLVINCNKEDRIGELEKTASDLGIYIVHKNILNDVEQLSDEECKDVLSTVYEKAKIKNDEHVATIWIGHDIFTGKYAIRLAEYSLGMSVVCIHTDYDTIEGLKESNKKGITKENDQRRIIQNADVVFAIGPRLLERVKEVRPDGVYELIPGILALGKNNIFNERAVITYGRFEGNVAQVKQAYLALAAFGRAVAMMNNNKDYVLHIIGTPQDDKEEKKLREIAERYAEGRKLSINFLEYTQDRNQLFACLENNCAGLMVSISEGFGLTGWEMISVGIPLILTKKSGLYDYLDKKYGYILNGMCIPVDLKGSSIENLREEDVQIVAEKITLVFKEPRKLRNSAEKLKANLRGETWYKAAGRLARIIGISPKEYSIAEIYSDTYKARKDCIEEILNALEINKIGKNYLIFFGGISKALCEKRAIAKITRWLDGDSNRRLFLCYESGVAAAQRAQEIDKNTLPADDKLSKNPKQRMKEKEELVEKSYYMYPEAIRPQITFVKLENSPMTYTIIVDQYIYFTVLLQTRSSESMTMKIDESSVYERRIIIESLEFVIDKQNVGESEKRLLEILADYKEKYL